MKVIMLYRLLESKTERGCCHFDLRIIMLLNLKSILGNLSTIYKTCVVILHIPPRLLDVNNECFIKNIRRPSEACRSDKNPTFTNKNQLRNLVFDHPNPPPPLDRGKPNCDRPKQEKPWEKSKRKSDVA